MTAGLNILLTLLSLISLWFLLHLVLRQRGEGEIVAHRGAASVAPENTLPAILAGASSGANYLEIDLRRSADGALIAIHDDTVDRTTDGQGKVGDLPLCQLRQLDAGGWISPEFQGIQIPTLEEVFQGLETWPGTLAIEVKDPSDYPGIAQDLAKNIWRRGFPRIILLSFNHAWLAEFRQHNSDIPTGELSVLPPLKTSKPDVQSIGVNWLAPILDPTLVARTHRNNQHVWVWTVDRAWQQRLLSWLGVDGITTNDPAQAVSNLKPGGLR